MRICKISLQNDVSFEYFERGDDTYINYIKLNWSFDSLFDGGTHFLDLNCMSTHWKWKFEFEDMITE